MQVQALIFDMDGTMIDSMPWHAQSWIAFTQRHGMAIDVDELMRRTTGRTGIECMCDLFGRDLDEAEALSQHGVGDLGVLVESGGEADRIGEAAAEHTHRQGRGIAPRLGRHQSRLQQADRQRVSGHG